MTNQAASFFRRTRIASPCRCVVPDAGHPLHGHAGDKGPESAGGSATLVRVRKANPL